MNSSGRILSNEENWRDSCARPVYLKPIIQEVLKLIRSSLPAFIDIRQNLKGNPFIMTDETQIHQVLMNLCTNAGHAMQKTGGTLTVDLETIEIETEL